MQQLKWKKTKTKQSSSTRALGLFMLYRQGFSGYLKLVCKKQNKGFTLVCSNSNVPPPNNPYIFTL